jgi:hypothetical protein
MVGPQTSLGCTTAADTGPGVGVHRDERSESGSGSRSALTYAMRQTGDTEFGATGGGLESWKWAKEQNQDSARALA